MTLTDSVLEIKRTPSEYIRGIAIVFVVLGHILGGTFGIIDTHFTSILGIGGVTVFLLLSGYGLYQSYRKKGINGKDYWNKKIKKVFFPYAIITILYFIYRRRIGGLLSYSVLFSNLLCIDYDRTIDGTMWYMSFLLLWYISFFAVFYFEGFSAGKVAVLFLLGFAFHDYWFKNTFSECAWQFSVNAFSFPCGVGIGYLTDLFNSSAIPQRWKKGICFSVRIGALVGSLAVFTLGFLKVIQASYWIYGLALFFILYTLLSLPTKKISVMKWLGSNSFMIYLIEGKLIAIWNRFSFLKSNVAIYLLSYAAATVIILYLYRFVASYVSRLFSYLEKNLADCKNKKS